MNNQLIEKRNTVCETLEVHSIFKTIQGEGPFTGHRSVFMRLAGCNLQCPGCDTDYTSSRKSMTPEMIVETVRSMLPTKSLVVITGGEPFRQYITPTVKALIQKGYRVQIETNGTLPPISWSPGLASVTIVCSPKTGSVNKALIPYIHSFKYVINWRHVSPIDGLPVYALDHPASPQLYRPQRLEALAKMYPGRIYLQPEDCGNETDNAYNVDAVIASCMQHGYRVQLQTHKILNME